MAESRRSCRTATEGQQRDATTQPCFKVRLLSLPLSLLSSKSLQRATNAHFVPVNSQKVPRPGSQQTPLCSWKRQPLFSETLGPSLWLTPHLPFRSIMLSGQRRGAGEVQLQWLAASQWGLRIPSLSSPRPQNKTQRAFDTSLSCEK